MSEARDRIERVLGDQDKPIDPGAEVGIQPDPHPDRTKMFVTAGFHRMTVKWAPDDEEVLVQLRAFADDIIRDEFRVAFAIIDKLRRRVRQPAADSDGVALTYDDGSPKWVTDEDGIPEENWAGLDDRMRVWALFAITTHLLEWNMMSADQWARSMFAKVHWEQAFAHGFTALPDVHISGKPTIDDRTQYGQKLSVDQRYFAVFQTYLSKRAEAVVRSMEKLQFLLDKTTSR